MKTDALPKANQPPDPSEALTHDNAPTSFGVFKPVGRVMVGLPSTAHVDRLAQALGEAGWAPETLQRFAPRESVEELEAMIDQAGPLAGLGYEIKMLQRYLAQTRQGVCWLLVTVDSTEHAATLAGIARQHEATMAVHYRLMAVEDLL